MVLLIAALGLVFGSFLSAVTYRLPREKSFTKGRSKCTHCHKEIKWFDNIPLFSYLVLKGRCRNCGKTISPRYPLIELFTSLGFILVYFLYRGDPQQVVNFGALTLPYLLFLVFLSFAILIIDLEEMQIPDSLVFLGFLVTMLLLIVFDAGNIFGPLFSGFVTASFLLAINLITKGKGMGLGDVKLAVFFGLVLGTTLVFSWLFLAFLTGAALGSILILTKKARFGKPIAFGPFLVVSFLATVFWGEKITTFLTK